MPFGMPRSAGPLNLNGFGYWVLQGLRVCTVITLLAAAAGCWVLIIQVDKYKTFFVFQCLSFFFTSMGCLFLITAEFPVIKFLRNFYKESWPVLSDGHGVGWMGAAIVIIGFHVLGSLNEQGYDTDAFTGHFSQLVLASGILCVLFGCLNIIAALIWRDAKHGITSRDIRRDGSLAGDGATLPSYSASPAASVRNEKTRSKFLSKVWKRGGDNERPNISAPFSDERLNAQPRVTSPIVPGLKRPDTALHPMHGHPDRASSQYSVADNAPRV
ncbi:hypothetical protein ISF_00780 [Cordyceps fumosorosea ARSEF 2679]|uniref:DUF7598 domain-containing protein n=1 Tax=Cordyceps fumosorosea (strain ARSEF 2679) TaxID=1081104 RepID=A0A162N194_CORFA|nr:hypothetical protein ISF_00780 [Cordyceps fumosorosea ARSEF 2679]OAA73879.1 hypothetical protein ISF_00780 [Cordyceps fumosorosea ARSEF 2679]